MACFLFCTCILSVLFTQKASASVNNTYGWAFGISGVFDSQQNILNPNSSGNYILNENSVIVCTAFASSTDHGYSNFYISLDGVYIGSQTSSSIFYDYWTSGNVYYNAMQFKNLTPGTHTIEVKADRPWDLSDGPAQKIDTINVYVPGITIPVTSITLSKTSLSLLKGDAFTLTASILPTNATNKGVTWKSSNTAIATVDSNGIVTGVAAGTATITCTANDGSGRITTCNITVMN
jgi:uncharacterized protein YjdB